MMLIMSVLGLVLGGGVWFAVGRRSAISEEELDRRLARLRRAELSPTDEERDRHEANLNAILNGDRLIAAPRPPRQLEGAAGFGWRVSTRAVRWLPRVALSGLVVGLAAGRGLEADLEHIFMWLWR